MGDSISSGEGTYGTYLPGTDTTTNKCHRSPNSYAAQFVGLSINSASWNLTNVACSGAGTTEIQEVVTPNIGDIPDSGELAQEDALSASTKLVTLTIGANDLNIGGFVTECYTQSGSVPEDNCFKAIQGNSTYEANLAALSTSLDEAYQSIETDAPNATVAVLTYPLLYPQTYTSSCETFGPFGIGVNDLVTSQDMLNSINGIENQLDSTITQAVEQMQLPNFILVDEKNALAGHQLCSADPWVNQLNNVNVSAGTDDDESLHPNVAGYHAMAVVLADRLDAGHFVDRSVDQGIANAYTSEGGLSGLGLPADNGSGPYVHYWGSPQANVEDFAGGSDGPAIMVDGPNGTYGRH
ncbi:MAG: SGNH/GDSL hydrolase family protein [Streptosporangiaceae bacterium]